MRRATALAAAAAALFVVAGCGSSAPDELSRDDVQKLTDAQERIGDALEQEETMRTDRRQAARLRARVQKIVSSGSFETARPDEFGIAMLGELRRFAPSLVQVRRTGDVYALDKPATRAFLAYATSDPKRALEIPVRRQVQVIDDTVDDSDAEGDTRVPPPDRTASSNETVDSYLRSVESDLRPVYPAQASRLAKLRTEGES